MGILFKIKNKKLFCKFRCNLVNNMTKKINYIISILLYFLCCILNCISNDTINYANFYWQEAKITPEVYKNVYWYEISFLEDNPLIGFVCGDNSCFAKTKDGGKTWTASRICDDFFHAESVHFANENVGYVSGSGAIFKTTNGGATWKQLKLPYMGWASTWGNYIVGQDSVWLVAGDCQLGEQYIFFSSNGGRTWRDTSFTIYNSHLIDITILDRQGLGYIIASGLILKTIDGGKRWTLYANTPKFYNNRFNWHEDIGIYNNSFVIPAAFGCSGSDAENTGGMAFSKDGGKTWNTYITDGAMFGSFILNETTGFVCGKNQNVYYTNNAGKTWNDIHCGIPEARNLDDLWFFDDTTGIVVGEGIYLLARKDTVLPLTSDTSLCYGETSALLKTTPGFNRYEWYKITDNNDTVLVKEYQKNTHYLTNIDDGTYFVVAYNTDCYSLQSNSVKVSYFPELNLKVLTDKENYCDGDTAVVWFEASNELQHKSWSDNSQEDTIKLSHSGKYWLHVIDINGCEKTVEFDLNFTDFEKPLLLLQGNKRICSGDTSIIILKNASKYSDIIWYCDDLEINRNVDRINIYSSGNYHVHVMNGIHCQDDSDTISIEFATEQNVLELDFNSMNPFMIDSTYYNTVSCNKITVYNKSDKDFELTNVILSKKLSFTVPLSQFPITVPANGSADLIVCYSPQSLEYEYDTLNILDMCSGHYVPVYSHGSIRFDTSYSRCEIPVSIQTKKINNNNKFVANIPVPNPSNISTIVSYGVFSDGEEDFNESCIDVKLFDILGKEIKTNYINKINRLEEVDNDKIVYGQIELNTANINPGIYLLNLNYLLYNFTYKLIIVK